MATSEELPKPDVPEPDDNFLDAQEPGNVRGEVPACPTGLGNPVLIRPGQPAELDTGNEHSAEDDELGVERLEGRQGAGPEEPETPEP